MGMISTIDIDRPDHPALRGPGCQEQMRKAFIIGVVIGATIGGVYSGSKGLKYGLERREILRVVYRQMLFMAFPCGFLMAGVGYLRC